MTSCRYFYATGLTILVLTIGGFSQQTAIAKNSSGRASTRRVTLTAGSKQKMDFSLRMPGSVTGRVFADAEPYSVTAGDPFGFKGVKVTLRSCDAGFERFLVEQFTDETGMYEFAYLRPGNYTIVIDPADLPTQFPQIR